MSDIPLNNKEKMYHGESQPVKQLDGPVRKKIPLIECQISLHTYAYTYDGTPKEPAVIVIDRRGKMSDRCYSVTYHNNVNVGTGTAVIVGNEKEDVQGTAELHFSIERAKQNLSASAASDVIRAGEKTRVNVEGAYGKLSYQIPDTTATVDEFGVVTGQSKGSASIVIYAAGDQNYLPAETKLSLRVKPKRTLIPVIAGTVSALLVSGTGGYFGLTAEVPDVIGQPVETAQTMLLDKSFSSHTTQEYSHEVGVGIILSEESIGKRLWRGTEIELVESLGPESVKWSDFTSQNAEDVKDTLEQMGLNVVLKKQEGECSDVPIDCIAVQEPLVNQTVLWGDTVTFYVSQGVITPNVVGLTQEEAETILKEHGLLLAFDEAEYSDTVEKGKIIRQSIAKDTVVNGGDTIVTVLSKGKEQREVPNLVGMTIEEASSALKKHDLLLQVSEQKIYSDTPADHICKQAQNFGTKVDKGSTVVVTLSKGSEPKPIVPESPAKRPSSQNSSSSNSSTNKPSKNGGDRGESGSSDAGPLHHAGEESGSSDAGEMQQQ